MDFVGRNSAQRELPVITADFQHTIGAFGFTASMCAAWVGAGKQRATRFFFIDWPPDWRDRYVSRGWLEQDFIVAEACRRMMPFSWEEVRLERALTAAEEEVYAAARAYGWTDVFAVPMHGPAGYQSLVTMASTAPCPLSLQDKAALQMIALTVHDQCRSAVPFGDPDGSHAKLSRRELESMRWVAAGKTDWEIGQLLGVAAATVHYHVERAKKKLDTKTRAQAVALLVLRGLV